MILDELETPLSKLPGAGEKTVAALAGAGVTDLRSLLSLSPRAYEDRSVPVPLDNVRSHLSPVAVVTIVRVVSHDFFGPPHRKTLKIRVRDGSASAALLCFGRNFLSRTVRPGADFLLSGNFSESRGEISASSFDLEPATPEVSRLLDNWLSSGTVPARFPRTGRFGSLLPRYRDIGGLGEQKIRSLLSAAIDAYGVKLEDPVPPAIRERHGFPAYAHALSGFHRPRDAAEARDSRRRLAYGELFTIQLESQLQARARSGAAAAKADSSSAPAATPARGAPAQSPFETPRRVLEGLGWKLTVGQQQISQKLLEGLATGRPMNVLIQGDVGSGKTILGLLAAAGAADLGGQSVLMAPTDILARQHAETAQALLGPVGLTVGLLTSDTPAAARRLLRDELAAGTIHLLVGTHAVYSADLSYKNLLLAVIDEQHRFGVRQRAALLEKGGQVHQVLMSATPIPRSLAIALFGDMDIETLTEKPANRVPIETHLARMGNEAKVYDFVARKLEAGARAYFVYPRVEDEDDRIKSVEAMYAQLSKEIFPGYSLGLLHGRMSDEEKTEVMLEFKRGGLQILVATTVVEVGLDVPEATCIVIEHAERFGLAALHQLRGRVGRSSQQSFCFLVYSEPLTDIARERLRVLKTSSDGFEIAEKDLSLRGPGDLGGLQQSGFLRLDYADLALDLDLMKKAADDARALLAADPDLVLPEHRLLAKMLERRAAASAFTEAAEV